MQHATRNLSFTSFFFLHGHLTFNKFNKKRKQILVLILVTDVYQEKNPKIVYYSM